MPDGAALAPPRLPSPESLSLPPTYRQQARNLTLDANRDAGAYWSPWRIAESARWQHHVYAWAARLARECRASRVLDVGCGVCTKLIAHLEPAYHRVEGVDQDSALAVARARGCRVPLHAIDLEDPRLALPAAFDLIVCADVIEHLVDPDPMLRWLKRVAAPGARVLFSTPERARERGRDCLASNKPEHVREWSRPEFAAFLRSRGFRILRSRLLPKDDAPIGGCRESEVLWRLRRAPTSKLCCQAVLCRIEGTARAAA